MDSKQSRRDFLRFLGVGSTKLALSSLALGGLTQQLSADHHCSAGSWGGLEGNVGGWTCDNHPGYKILEIYLNLGASQWESFWLPGTSSPNYNDYGMSALARSDLSWLTSNTFPCESPDMPTSVDESRLFASQSGGGNIYWGAPTKPIFRRNDIFSRCRMVTQYHDLRVHRLANTLVLTGSTLGSARRAGSGAAIQRRARSTNPEQLLPTSYVFYRGDEFDSPHQAAVATGVHPGFSRPVDIRITDSNSFVTSLARTGVSTQSDDLLLALRHEYRDRMRFRGAGSTVRSTGFDGYWVAAELLKNAPQMQALFGNNILVRDTNIAKCASHPEEAGQPLEHQPGIKTMLHAAASLLSSGPARYVCTIDKGLMGTFGYDTHSSRVDLGPHLLNTSASIYNVMHHLADIIHHPVNNPSGTLNLDDTMIVINSDFNRTPTVNGNLGRDHWPYGGSTIMIGGPINGGPSIQGRIDTGGSTETAYQYSPTDMRGAVLLAAGIDPFADGNFRVSDFSPALTNGIATEVEIRNRLKGDILGV